MKTTFILLIFATSVYFSKSQSIKIVPLLISSDTLDYSIFDTTCYYQIKRFPNKKFNNEQILFLNNSPVDTVILNIDNPRYINNEIIIEDREKYTLHKLTMAGFENLDIPYYTIDANGTYYLTKNYQDIYSFNSTKEKIKRFIDLSPYLCNKTHCYGFEENEVTYQIVQLNDNSYFIRTCTGDIACIYSRYYLYNSKNNTVKDINGKIKSFSEERLADTERTIIAFSSEDSKLFSTYTDKFRESIRDTFTVRSFIMDENLNKVNSILTMGYDDKINNDYSPNYIQGLNVQNNKLVNYFLSSYFDDKKFVSVYYRFNPALEILFYKAFHNKILTTKEINILNDFELNLLKNLIFAKHNYKFKSEFYQAYFNLYAFYNGESMRKARVEEVTTFFTVQDKENIKLINQIIK